MYGATCCQYVKQHKWPTTTGFDTTELLKIWTWICSYGAIEFIKNQNLILFFLIYPKISIPFFFVIFWDGLSTSFKDTDPVSGTIIVFPSESGVIFSKQLFESWNLFCTIFKVRDLSRKTCTSWNINHKFSKKRKDGLPLYNLRLSYHAVITKYSVGTITV
jgi:hypothetical protein